MATVTISSLQCEQTYSIIAGGIITVDVTMDRTLDGPRFHSGIITAAACPVTAFTTSKKTIIHIAST